MPRGSSIVDGAKHVVGELLAEEGPVEVLVRQSGPAQLGYTRNAEVESNGQGAALDEEGRDAGVNREGIVIVGVNL